MNLSKEVKNQQVIVFHDKSTKFVSEKEAELVFQASAQTSQKMIRLSDGSTIAFSSIAKIQSDIDYYNDNPDKRPPSTYNQFEELYGDTANQQIRKPTKQAKELMKQGFIKAKMEMYGKTKEQAEKEFEAFIDMGVRF